MRISIVIILALLLAASCGRETLPHSSIQLLGHGGEGFSNKSALYAPNTVGSLSRALDFYNLDGVEVDVRFLADTSLIVFHDAHLETATQCKGLVSRAQPADVVGCNYRKQFKNVYQQQIISLDSFIWLLNYTWLYQRIHIQVHFEDRENKIVEQLAKHYAQRVQKINDLTRITTECANANFLFYLRNFGNFSGHLVAPLNNDGVNDVFRFGLQGIVSRFDIRNDTLEKHLKDSGKYITLYGQKLSKDYTKWRYDIVDAIQIDNPIQALKYFRDK